MLCRLEAIKEKWREDARLKEVVRRGDALRISKEWKSQVEEEERPDKNMTMTTCQIRVTVHDMAGRE